MKKKIIIGTSSYAGSNTTDILSEVERFVSSRSQKRFKVYSLKQTSPENLVKTILADQDDDVVYIIKHIRDVNDLRLLKVQFADEEFKPIGIEVPWEHCFENFQNKGKIAKTVDKHEWRDKDMEDPFRKAIVKCFAEIGTRNDNVYLFQPGDFCEQIGKIADVILLLIQ